MMRWPAFAETALLLDMDGTLLDLAPTPDAVVVPAGLPVTLTQLSQALAGALAVITGRPVEQVDALLPGIVPAVGGEHGGVFRPGPGQPLHRLTLPDLPAGWLALAEAAVAKHPGALLEVKRRGLVLHFRLAPQHGPALHQAALELAAADQRFQVLQASMAWEIRPRGVNKGGAVAELMQLAPFAGRHPVFIGDDVTDLDGIAMAEQLGGHGLLVQDWFTGPSGVRGWLAGAAAAGHWPELHRMMETGATL